MSESKSASEPAGKGTEAHRGMPRVSEAEWVVMRVLWERSPRTTNQVVEALQGRMHWKPKTIHTLLRRLVQKGALHFAKSGRVHEFRPRVRAEDCERALARSFLERFFDGDLGPFLARFVEHQKLTEAEVARLKRILDGGDGDGS